MSERVAAFLLMLLGLGLILSVGLEVAYAETNTTGDKYNRKAHFGSGWIDADRDCQDTRQEVLIEESLVTPVLTEDGCRVMSGVWICAFTGEVFVTPLGLDIDHRVPLKEAWLSGADTWSKARRIAYANDLINPEHLIAVKAGANRSKGAKDIAGWLPDKNIVEYLYHWIDVKENYSLTFDSDEVWAIIEAVEGQYSHPHHKD